MTKQAGRKPIQVIDSNPYSQIIFLVASGCNYAQEIAKQRKAQPSPTVKQLKDLQKLKFLRSEKEKLLNKTTYVVNWEKINEEFVNYLYNIVLRRRQQSIAQLGEKYKSNKNEEDSFKEFEILKRNKKLNRNKYLSRLFEILFGDYSKAYVQSNIPMTIKEAFEEAKQSLSFEIFNYEFVNSKSPQLKSDVEFREMVFIEEALRSVYRGFLTLNASAKLASEIKKSIESSSKTTKPMQNNNDTFGNTHQHNTFTSENEEMKP
jgi:hypothetical protein